MVSDPLTAGTSELTQDEYDRLRHELDELAAEAKSRLMAIARETKDPYTPSYILDLDMAAQLRIINNCGAHVMLYVRQSLILASIAAAEKHVEDSRKAIKSKKSGNTKASKREID